MTAVGFYENGQFMYSGGEDATARIWDLRMGYVLLDSISPYLAVPIFISPYLSVPIPISQLNRQFWTILHVLFLFVVGFMKY